MKSLSFLITLLSFLICGSIYAKPVNVKLDTQKEIVAYHTAALLFGLRYESGAIIGSGLFSDADLRAGVMEKTIQIDETQKIVNCEYQWLITSDSVPGAGPDPVLGKLSLPVGFDGIVRGKCEVDLAKSEIILSTQPYKVEKLELNVDRSSLINRKAKAVIVRLSPRGEGSDKYGSFSSTITNASTFPVVKVTHFLSKEAMVYNLQSNWVLLAGGLEKDEREYKDGYIQLR